MQRDRNPRWRRIKSSPFHRIGDSYGHFFNRDHFLGRTAFDGRWMTADIPSNIKKTKDGYEMELALPGFKKSEITVYREGNILNISAKMSDKDQDKTEVVAGQKLPGSVSRSFQLNDETDKENISSQFENGLLKVSLPYNKKIASKPKRKIQVG